MPVGGSDAAFWSASEGITAHVERLDDSGNASAARVLTGVTPIGPGATIEVAREPAGDTFVLVTDAEHRTLLNGRPVVVGASVLRHRDEIRTHDGATWRFSNDARAEAAPFPGVGHPVRCPRCTTDIEVGTPAVRCPKCELYHHERADLPCWSSEAFCGGCFAAKQGAASAAGEA